MDKKIPFANYVKVFLICCITVILVVVVFNNYKNREAYELNTNDVMSTLYEVKAEELSNYLLENREIILYISSSAVTENQTFEKKLIKYIIDNDFDKDVIYLNTKDFSDYSSISNNFTEELKKQDIDYTSPNLLLVENGVVTDVLYRQNKQVTVDDIVDFKNFLKEHVID